jgi:S-DNA-T family DNA segregation ATPase FtsK/SpoIIIE
VNKRKSKKRSFNGFNSISLSPSIKTYLIDAFILFLLLVAIISTIALASFTREDAAWTTQNIVGETSYQNAIGMIGAWISDLLYSFFGVVAWIVPSLFYLVTFAYLFNKDTKEVVTQSSWVRFFVAMPFGLVLIAISSSALVAIHFNFGESYFPQGSEGILGKIISSPLILYLNKVGASIFVLFLFLLGITAFFKINWKNFVSNFLDFIVNSSFYIKHHCLLEKIFKFF